MRQSLHSGLGSTEQVPLRLREGIVCKNGIAFSLRKHMSCINFTVPGMLCCAAALCLQCAPITPLSQRLPQGISVL